MREHLRASLLALTAMGMIAAAAPREVPAAKPRGYVVHLASGQTVKVKSKPIIAYGSVRFVGLDGRVVVLKGSAVNIEATRAANASRGGNRSRGTFNMAAPTAAQADDDRRGPKLTRATAKQTGGLTVYSATWCGPCKALKKYLSASGIEANIINVDLLPKSEQAPIHAKMKKLTGQVAYPTLVSEKGATGGWSPEWIRNATGK